MYTHTHTHTHTHTGGMPRMPGVVQLEDYVANHSGAALSFYRAGFDAAVYIMFSSGTTGAPKCMVQGCGMKNKK